MPRYEITKFFSNSGSRNEVRMRVVDALAAETPGTGNGEDASKYIYYVETLNSGDRVYLQRPANLHNGFDFMYALKTPTMLCRGSEEGTSPSTKTWLWIYKQKAENEEMYAVHGLLRRVFECEDVSDDEMDSNPFSTGLPVDHILKAIKWLFIEQDIRYWNYSGRNMTWGYAACRYGGVIMRPEEACRRLMNLLVSDLETFSPADMNMIIINKGKLTAAELSLGCTFQALIWILMMVN